MRVRLSQIKGANFKPGLQFKIPFMDRVVKFDRRVLTRKFDGEQFLTSESQGLTDRLLHQVAHHRCRNLLPGDQRRRRRPRRIAGRRHHPGRHQERRGRPHAQGHRHLRPPGGHRRVHERRQREAAEARHPAHRRARAAHRPAGRSGQQRLRQHEAHLRRHRAHAARRRRSRGADRQVPKPSASAPSSSRERWPTRSASAARATRPPRPSTPPRTTATPSSIRSIAACRPIAARSATMAT